MTDQTLPPKAIRQLLLERPIEHTLSAYRQVCQRRWDGKGEHPGDRLKTTEERYQAVLLAISDLKTLLPNHEDRARDIFARISWPKASHRNSQDFVPPKFEKALGLPCARCNGTGVTGFFIGIRCPSC